MILHWSIDLLLLNIDGYFCNMLISISQYFVFSWEKNKNKKLPDINTKFGSELYVSVVPFWCLLKCFRKTHWSGSYFFAQVIEIPRGSKVKYELDKKTGLIKVMQCGLLHILLQTSIFSVLICPGFVLECAGGPCAVFISCVPSQLWIHSSHTLWRQWPSGCAGYNAGVS